MKRLFLLIFTVFWLMTGTGQTDPLQSAYTFNMSYINPANTGITGLGSVFAWHRSQWLQMDGAPKTTMLTFEYPFRKMALGANLYSDTDGVIKRWNAVVNFSYVIDLNDGTSLAFGLSMGGDQFSYSPDNLNIKDPGESVLDNPQSIFRFVSGVGTTIYSERWFVGISSPNVIPVKVPALEEINQTYHSPNIYLSGGLNIPVSYNITLRPSTLVRYNMQYPVNVDATLLMSYQDKFTAGLTYRFNAAYILLASVRLAKNFYMGYSFDWDASELHNYNYGSHELFLKYEFATPSGKVRFQSPRFF